MTYPSNTFSVQKAEALEYDILAIGMGYIGMGPIQWYTTVSESATLLARQCNSHEYKHVVVPELYCTAAGMPAGIENGTYS